MGKEKNPRRVADNEAMAKLRMLRTSPQKLNLVAQMIRGKKVDKALTDLTFSKKRIADDVQEVPSVRHRQRREQPQPRCGRADRRRSLCRQEPVMKRGRPRARGRFGKI